MGKVKILVLLIAILICSSFTNSMFSKSVNDRIPTKDKIALNIINETATTLKERYKINPCGFGMGGGGIFDSLDIEFQVFRNLSKDEVREMLLNCVEEFLKNINSNEDIRPHLKCYPFTYENVSFTLFIYDKNHRDIFHPNISVASIGKRGLTFKTDDPDDRYKYKEISNETYEEALQLVNKMNEKDIH